MNAYEAEAANQRRIALADAPSGDPCPACLELHGSASAEADCVTDHEAHYNPEPLRTASASQLIGGGTEHGRLVQLYHDGIIDATDIPGVW